MAISDFVLLHNKAAEALAKSDRVGFDFYSGMADLKALFLKYCKPFEKRIRSMVPMHRVGNPAGEGEDPTSGILSWCKSKGTKTFAPMKIDMQYIGNLSLELHRDFSTVDYAQQ